MHASIPAEPQRATTPSIDCMEDAEGIDILDLLLSLLRAKREIALYTLVFLGVGIGISLILKPVFTAVTVIMPPQQEQSTAGSLMGQLGSLSSLGAASQLGLKNPADMYVGILQSRVIADSLIDRFRLQTIYREQLRSGAENRLRNNSEFEAAKDGLIYIRVKDHDPKRAAGLANAYVEELHSMNSKLAIGQAAQRRLFYDQQLDSERTALAAAEDDLKQTQEKTGLVQLSGQAQMSIRNIADARAQIAEHEVQLGVMRTSSTDQNPDVVRLQQEIVALKNQLAILENAQQHVVPGDLQIPGGRVAAASLEYLRKLREERYHESLYELLLKQREAAYIDEVKSAPVIQVVDPAVAPERRSGPSRALISLGLGFFGLLLTAAWAILRDLLRGMKRTPMQAARLEQLQRAVSMRKV